MEIKVKKDQLRIIILGLFSATVIVIGIPSFFILRDKDNNKEFTVEGNCLPTFRDGGGPYYKPNSPFRKNIAPDESNGQRLIVEGHVLSSDCGRAVAGVTIDIWQANESGNYEDEYYRGQIVTDENGYYKFETVVPLGYGEGTGYRPPHIHFKAFFNNQEIVTSQMFFPEVKGTPGFNDEYIMSIRKDGDTFYGKHNIVLPDFN